MGAKLGSRKLRRPRSASANSVTPSVRCFVADLSSRASPGSVTTAGHACADDWKEEIYQKILSMKEAYLPELSAQLQKVSLMVQKLKIVVRPAKLEERFERLESLKILLQCYIRLLCMKTNDIQHEMKLKEKLKFKEQRLKNLLTAIRGKRRAPSFLGKKNKRDPLKIQYPQQFKRPGRDTQFMLLEQETPVPPLRPQGSGHHGALASAQGRTLAVGSSGSWPSPCLPEIHSPDGNETDISTPFSSKLITAESPMDLSCELEYDRRISNMHSRETEIKGSVDAFAGPAATYDWRDEIYQAIQYMKAAYLEELYEQHEKFCLKLESLVLRGKQTEHLGRLRIMNSEFDGFIGWLNIKKECVLPEMKAKLSHYNRRIMNFLALQRRIMRASPKVHDP